MSDKDYASEQHRKEMGEYYALYPGDAGRELRGAWEHKFALMRECNAKSDTIRELRAQVASLTLALELEKENSKRWSDSAIRLEARAEAAERECEELRLNMGHRYEIVEHERDEARRELAFESKHRVNAVKIGLSAQDRAKDAERRLAESEGREAKLREAVDFLLCGNRIPFHWKDKPGGYFCAWCEAPWQRGHYDSCVMGNAIDAALSSPDKSRTDALTSGKAEPDGVPHPNRPACLPSASDSASFPDKAKPCVQCEGKGTVLGFDPPTAPCPSCAKPETKEERP